MFGVEFVETTSSDAGGSSLATVAVADATCTPLMSYAVRITVRLAGIKLPKVAFTC